MRRQIGCFLGQSRTTHRLLHNRLDVVTKIISECDEVGDGGWLLT